MLSKLEHRTNYFLVPSGIRFSGAFVCEGISLLPNTARHYSENRIKITSIFSILMSASTVRRGRPKGALMQTKVCVRQGLRFPAPRQGEFLPLDPDQPCADWMPGTCRRSITTKGADPLPLTPSQPSADWMSGRASAPCTTAGGYAPCDPQEARKL